VLKHDEQYVIRCPERNKIHVGVIWWRCNRVFENNCNRVEFDE